MKFSHQDFKMELRDLIKTNIRPYQEVSDTQMTIRCPICGDSKKDKRKMRFYIYFNGGLQDDEQPVTYYCFNCNEGGMLSTTILRDMEINDLDILSSLQSFNKSVVRKNKSFKFTSKKVDLKIPYPDTELESNILKKKYIEGRLGIDITFDELNKFKTVFRLGDLLLENDIQELTVRGEKAIDIHENYVGFLTTNNETLKCRQVFSDKSRGLRYEKYSLYKDILQTLKFYTIPTVVDTIEVGKITINLAEGVFDILGIYFNVHNGGLDRNIYTAVCGSGYKSVIKYFISEGIIGDVDINVYADIDQDLRIYKDLKDEYGIWFNSFNVYTNSIGKDFGVPASKINVVKNKI